MTKTSGGTSGGSPIKQDDIEALIEIFQNSSYDEMYLEIDGFEIFLSNDPTARPGSNVAPVQAAPAMHNPPAPTLPQGMGHVTSPSSPHPAPPSQVPAHWIAVTAPNLGTFYRAPKPGSAPYVEVGSSVDTETEICLIEVMKLFTAVRAGSSGIIRQICVSDAEMVEYGQTLFYIEPA
jgi:acetyl-CoA carboxylase biotin carboxyl carrier protein